MAIRLESEKAINQKRIEDLLAKPEVQENEGKGPESAVVETTETLMRKRLKLMILLQKLPMRHQQVEEVTEELVATEQPAGYN